MAKKLKVLTTGGTIGSALKGDGTVGIDQKAADKIRNSVYAQAAGFGVSRENVSIDEVLNVDSSEIDFNKRLRIAYAVKEAIDEGHDRILITHGTDRMHQTLTMLSLLFAHTKARIVMTGSMASPVAKDSDAPLNIEASVACALDEYAGIEPGVYLAFKRRENKDPNPFGGLLRDRTKETISADVIRGLDAKPAQNDGKDGYFEAHSTEKIYGTYQRIASAPDGSGKIARNPTGQRKVSPFLDFRGFADADVLPPGLKADAESYVQTINAEEVSTNTLAAKAKSFDPTRPGVLIVSGHHSGTVVSQPIKEFAKKHPNIRVLIANFPPDTENPYSVTADLADRVGVICHWQTSIVRLFPAWPIFGVFPALSR